MSPLRLIACALLAALAGSAAAQSHPADPLDLLLTQLSADDYQTRDDATRKIFRLGEAVEPVLRARLRAEADPEAIRRLRYILENIVPPKLAVLVVRADAETGLRAGDLITHVNGRRVRRQSEFRERLSNPSGSPAAVMLRVLGPEGPRELGPVDLSQFDDLRNFSAPRGERIAEALRLFGDGMAERAYDVLQTDLHEIPEDELSSVTIARIAHAAGDLPTALMRMAGSEVAVRSDLSADRSEWAAPSRLDLAAPGKAPFQLEWQLFTEGGPRLWQTPTEPDLRVQRVLVPAGRFADAGVRAAEIWWTKYRDELGHNDETNRIAGNQLAVCGWMFAELGLTSECCRIIEPRSAILRNSPRSVRKWVRVETDAWLPFLAGEEPAALDSFYADAFDVLRRPTDDASSFLLIQNPFIAARLAFFLYRFPDDPRVEEVLSVIDAHAHPLLAEYIYWMLLSLYDGNADVVRTSLHRLLPALPDAAARNHARAAVLLEYVTERPDLDVIAAARQRIFNTPPGPERDRALAVADAVSDVLRRRYDQAAATLAPLADAHELTPLRETVRFLSDPPASAANHAALADARIALPIGSDDNVWVILSANRRLHVFDAQAGTLAPLAAPSATWFPNPLTWPWFGRHAASGRTWIYDRRRVVELTPDPPAPLRLNIDTLAIPAFHAHLSSAFDRLAEAVADVPVSRNEDGEFLREELRANQEFFADPDLPEIGLIESLSPDGRYVHVVIRGGPHLILDTQSGRAWPSAWFQQELALAAPPTFFARRMAPDPDSGGERILLYSDAGLLRFEPAAESVIRYDLPGKDPHPPVIPESLPYERRDPRFAYCARLPEDGGAVYRLWVDDDAIEPLSIVNVSLPPEFYRVMTRSSIRNSLDRALHERNLPGLQECIADAARVVEAWILRRQEQP